MGANNYYSDGEWTFVCDLCGKPNKSSDAMKTWDNHYVCRHHKEVRNPQDFIRGVRDNPTPPWSRPEVPESYVTANFRLLQEDGGAILQQADSFGNTYNILV